LIAVGILIALGTVVATWSREPLRQAVEHRINAALDGYSVTIGSARLKPLNLSLELSDVTVVQHAMPDPPVAFFPRWTTGIEWRAVFSGALVADVAFTRPKVFLTIEQLAHEALGNVPASERGWIDAIAAVYPLKINRLWIDDGEVTLFDLSDLPPLH